MIVCKAPVRIDFGGGGSDIEPYSTEHGGFVINTAINQFVRTVACKRNDSIIKIISNDYNTIVERNSIEDLTYDTELDLIKAIIKRLKPNHGIDVFVRSDIPPKSGLGASASLSTSVIGALKGLMNITLSDHEIAEMGFLIEREDLKNIGGRQDQYTSVFGGFNQIEFLGGANVKVSKLNISSSFKKYLNDNMILAYTGKPHVSQVLQGHTDKYEQDNEFAVKNLDDTKAIAIELRDALINEDINQFAELITKDWEFKTKLNPSVTTKRMQLLDKIARDNGAIGARFCGAGGGGCMIWACKEDTKNNISNALKKEGANEIEFEFNDKGYEIINI
ncbi:MAG: hypothetical protein WC307_02220 [Candidatus Nanoarchaeia archaeon]|jgi:D-glycero-alpha-D-manno-heptose-7-phosphate kinase